MTTVEEIQNALQRLPKKDFSVFRDWFAEFDAALWDRQLEADIAAGKLDHLADKALEDLQQGRCTDL